MRLPLAHLVVLAATLPIDLIEEILLYLPGQDIIRMKRVRWDVGGLEA